MIKRNGHVVRALTIAGSDSGGGAGIQADLKTFHQFGVYGMSAVTALTAQNTQGVQAIHAIPALFVREQLHSVMTDLVVDAAKTGMLASEDICNEVADALSSQTAVSLVVDPVMVAKGGAELLDSDAVDVMRRRLLSRATVVTPNIPETELLTRYPLRAWSDCHRAARDIARWGAGVVVIKGGHLDAGPPQLDAAHYATDLVYEAGRDAFTYLATARIDSRKTHGTGCTYSAALTTLLARGADPLSAISAAKAFVYHAIVGARDWDVGSGHGPTDHSVPPTATFQPVFGSVNHHEGTWTVL